MSKDIEWLKEEVYKIFPSHSEMYEHPDDITVLKVKLLNEVINLIDQLDEPEVLSQEFIDEHSYNVHLLGTPDVETIAIPRDDLQNLLVPKQELPVIPQFVADEVVVIHDWDKGSIVLESSNITAIPRREVEIIDTKLNEVQND